MIRSRIFRLRSFWLGLIGLLFLLWAWRDSMDYSSWIFVKRFVTDGNARGSEVIYAGQSKGALRADWPQIDDSLTTQSDYSRVQSLRRPFTELDCFPAPGIETSHRPYSLGGSIVWKVLVLPYWLLMLVYLAAWAGVLAWRWKAFAKREAGWNPLATLEAP